MIRPVVDADARFPRFHQGVRINVDRVTLCVENLGRQIKVKMRGGRDSCEILENFC
jgi:hypothetical protein